MNKEIRSRKIIVLVFLSFFNLIALKSDTLSPTLTLVFLGDAMLGRGIADIHRQLDWNGIFAYLSPEMIEADLSFVNLESPICTKEVKPQKQNQYYLGAPEESLQALVSNGVNIVSLANNHYSDCPDLNLTIHALKRNNILEMENNHPQYRIIADNDFAFIAFNTVNQESDLNSMVDIVTDAHRKARSVIVSIHWGLEYQPGIDTFQKVVADKLSKAGAMIIWGHHPHVLQKMVWMKKSSDSRIHTLVMYSLGNAIFDQPFPDSQKSALIVVKMRGNEIKKIRIIPFVIDIQRGIVIAPNEIQRQSILRRLDFID